MLKAMKHQHSQAARIRVRGVVQGVGMRPFVATLANRFSLCGWCKNTDLEVIIHAQGEHKNIQDFYQELLHNPPPLAHIIDSEYSPTAPGDYDGFVITESTHGEGERTLLPPDTALCAQCTQEFHDPNNPRYHYPFITCTHCGPRLSIIEDLPYDRPNTTMKIFPMCSRCSQEYRDPQDRRYHAQPISCPDCGPRMWLEDSTTKQEHKTTEQEHPTDYDSLARSIQRHLDAGHIVACRGIGGFHLLVDAQNSQAVARLRARKHRPAKPFAVMVRDRAMAQSIAVLNEEELALLESPAHPIVITQHTQGLCPEVAPGLDTVGVMIAYSPLHLLFIDRPLVATSGNPSNEPLVTDNDQARHILKDIADVFIFHDRDIAVPVEDSVFVGTQVLRRSRGLAPLPVAIKHPQIVSTKRPQTVSTKRILGSKQPTVLAVGAEMKNTICVAHHGLAHLSAHIGQMGSLRAKQVLERSVEQLLAIRGLRPDLIVCDAHPEYFTSSWAQEYGERHDIPVLALQHHYCHALSLLAEAQSLPEGVVIVTDGTGYGTDGAIWGGEILHIQGTTMHRAYHLPYFPLAGGDRAIEQPWRILAGLQHRWQLQGRTLPALLNKVWEQVNPIELRLVRSQLDPWRPDQPHPANMVVNCSSLGRVFDAAGVLLGCAHFGTAVSYEAQVAMELENLATNAPNLIPSQAQNVDEALLELPELPAPLAARRFHHALARVLAQQAGGIARRAGHHRIGLSGGCALNQLFVHDLEQELAAHGVELLTHKLLPAGDGGLSLGQAVGGMLYLS